MKPKYTANPYTWENLNQTADELNLTQEQWKAIRLLVNGSKESQAILSLMQTLVNLNHNLGVSTYGYLVNKERSATVATLYELTKQAEENDGDN